MTKARIVVQTAMFSINFSPKLSNTVAKLMVLTGVTNPAPKPPSKLLRNLTRFGVEDSTCQSINQSVSQSEVVNFVSSFIEHFFLFPLLQKYINLLKSRSYNQKTERHVFMAHRVL